MKNHEQTNIWPQAEELNPWLDRSDALSQVEKRQAAGEFDAETAQKLRQWHQEGYLLLPNLIEPELLDRLLEAFEECYRTGKQLAVGSYLHPLSRNTEGHFGTVTGAFMELAEYRDILLHPKIMEWNRLIVGREVFGAQSSFFFTGSEQPIHHDQVHETTRPYGMSIIMAIAFEDIHPDAGPLVYYPGSHRLGYITADQIASQAGLKNSQELIDRSMLDSLQHKQKYSSDWFKEYGIACNLPLSEIWAERIAAAGLEPQYFVAKKGDVLLLHTNLAHGGSAIRDPHLSRKSMVSKYAATGVGFYHEIAPDYKHDRLDLAYHKGYPYLVEEHLPFFDKNTLDVAANPKDREIAQLKAELAAMQKWAEETRAQSENAVASLTEHLQRKEQELLKAHAWIIEKEAESQRVAAAYQAALKSKEIELANAQDTLRKKEKFYAEAIAAYQARQPYQEPLGIYRPKTPGRYGPGLPD